MEEIEFHDSYLLAVDPLQGTLDLNAWVHLERGLSEQSGGYKRVRLTLLQLTIQGALGALPFDICTDHLVIDDSEFRDLLQLPSKTLGSIKLTLGCREDGREVTFLGTDLSVAAVDE
jgi:hypothetical protein